MHSVPEPESLRPWTNSPVDYIQAKPLKERLRNVNNIKGVKLYDVLQYEPAEIKRVKRDQESRKEKRNEDLRTP